MDRVPLYKEEKDEHVNFFFTNGERVYTLQTAKEMVVMTPCKRCEEGASNVHILCIFYAHATRQSLVVLFPVAPRQIIYQHIQEWIKSGPAESRVSLMPTDRLFEVP